MKGKAAYLQRLNAAMQDGYEPVAAKDELVKELELMVKAADEEENMGRK